MFFVSGILAVRPSVTTKQEDKKGMIDLFIERFYLLIFRERGREGEMERNTKTLVRAQKGLI